MQKLHIKIFFIFIINFFTGNLLLSQQIASGSSKHILVLNSDGTMFSWGRNDFGQLGNGNNNYFFVPIKVDMTGVLLGKKIIQVATGNYHSVALADDGTVYSWGRNWVGQLGNGNNLDSNIPVAVDMSGVLSGKSIVQIASGGSHVLALASDGTLYSWGYNSNGELGNGNNKNSSVPVAVDMSGALSGKNIIQIAAGETFSIALSIDGKVYTWGSNHNGQLGIGYMHPSSNTPVEIYSKGTLNGKLITQIAAGGNHAMVLTSDGKVYSWGLNTKGQLGIVTSTDNSIAAPVYTKGVLEGKIISKIATGTNHSLALDTNGTLYSWGANDYGQLGKGNFFTSEMPSKVVDKNEVLSNKPIIQIAGVYHNTIVLTNDGLIAIWGANDKGQLGNGNNKNSSYPIALSTNGINSYREITHIEFGHEHSIGLAIDGTVYTWGRNNYGQLGIGSTGLDFCIPQRIVENDLFNEKTFIQVAAGDYHSLALTSEGSVYTWGRNNYGQLGNGNNTDSNIPIPVLTDGVLNGKKIIQIAAGNNHSLVLTDEGKVYGWGQNDYGQLGNRSNIDSYTPVAVNMSVLPYGKKIIQIDAGGDNSVALADDGTVLAWGFNYYGELGNGKNVDSNIPVVVSVGRVLSGNSIIQISTGGGHSLALTDDGKVLSWGWNWQGQLGIGNEVNSNLPVFVDLNGVLSGKKIVKVAAGGTHSIALTSDGKVYTWGYNWYGQLGINSKETSYVPVEIFTEHYPEHDNFSTISAGDDNSFALSIDGSVFSWGKNTYGQLGNGNFRDYNIPIILISTPGLGPLPVEESKISQPNEFSLLQNYPNPFNPATTITYSLTQPGFVSLKVYDILGNEVATLVNDYKNSGTYNQQFSISDYQLSSGIYFYRLKTGNIVQTKKMVLLK